MITKPTVLILGAGASAPYGFPTGRSLLLQITAELSPGVDGELRRNLASFPESEITEFQANLLDSNQPSVDAFLESRPNFTELGKTAIAIKLIGCEKPDALKRTAKQEWYEYLWYQLGPRKDDFWGSKLSVITFNYDRSFEYSLFRSLQSAFGLSEDDAADTLKSIPITHVYGQLGLPDFLDKKNGRSYAPDLNAPNLKRAVSGIEIVRESEGVPSDRAEAIHKALSNAEVVCYLGFGYHEANVERLKLQSFKGARFLGSGLGLARDERRKVVELFAGGFVKKRIDLGAEGADTLDFIRSEPVFE